jgi:hypothetical protein
MCRKQLVQLELPEQLPAQLVQPEQPGLLELQPVRPVQLERLLQSLI